MKERSTLLDTLPTPDDDGDQPSVVQMRRDDALRWSRRELAGHVERVAGAMHHRGIGPGDRVMFYAPNSATWIAAALATIRCGAIATPIDAQFQGDLLEHVIRDADPAMLVTTRRKLDRHNRLQDVEHVMLLDQAKAEHEDDERLFQNWSADADAAAREHRHEADPEDQAVLFYTSGTTGPPKGVPLTHRNLMYQIDTFLGCGIVRRDDRFLLPLPLHHVYPFVLGMLAPLAGKSPVVLPASLTGPQMLRAMREGEVTIMIGVPRIYRALNDGIESRVAAAGSLVKALVEAAIRLSAFARRRLKIPLGRLMLKPLHRRMAPKLRIVTSGGSPLDAALAWRLEGIGWRVITGYGLTETAPLLAWNLPDRADFNTAGRPLDGVELRIDNDAHTENTSSDDEPEQGEVLAKGPGVFAGYRNLPDKTDQSFSDGFFRTGDLGFIDDLGFLHVSGRVSTMIVTEQGENVQPEDLEEVYEQHEAIQEIGVLERDGKLVALVVPETGGESEDARQHIEQAIDEVAQQIPSFQRLAAFRLSRKSLPRTHLGKLRRDELERRYDQPDESSQQEDQGPLDPQDWSAEDRQLLADPAIESVWDWLAERYDDQPLSPDSQLQADLGIDSMAWLNLTLEVSRRSGIELDDEAIGRVQTVRDLLEEVASGDGGEAVSWQDAIEQPDGKLTESQRRWLRPLGPLQRAIFFLVFVVGRFLVYRFYRIDVQGLEHVPKEGSRILAPHHESHLDPFLLGAVLGRKQLAQTYWGGWTGWAFAWAPVRMLSRIGKVIPIDSRRSPRTSLAFAAAVLEKRRQLVWFPEGQRSASGELLAFKPGIGALLAHRDVPVVPVMIRGTHEAMPVGQHLPRPGSITIRFGPPQRRDELRDAGEGQNDEQRIADGLRRRVAELNT